MHEHEQGLRRERAFGGQRDGHGVREEREIRELDDGAPDAAVPTEPPSARRQRIWPQQRRDEDTAEGHGLGEPRRAELGRKTSAGSPRPA